MIEEADQAELVGSGRGEAAELGGHLQIPAAARSCRRNRRDLRLVPEEAQEPERVAFAVLLVDAEVGHHRAHRAPSAVI